MNLRGFYGILKTPLPTKNLINKKFTKGVEVLSDGLAGSTGMGSALGDVGESGLGGAFP